MDQQLPLNSASEYSSETWNNVASDTIEPENNVDMAAVKNEYWRYIPLLKAALRGDWDEAKRIFDQDASAITAPINSASETALHIAVGTGHRAIHFVEKLVERMQVKDLTLRDKNGNTALHAAAEIGNKGAAVALVQKNPDLPYLHDNLDLLPIHVAAANACKNTLLYLLTVTKDDHMSGPYSNKNAVRLVNSAISSGFYDVALNLVQRYPQAAKSKDDHRCVLQTIAEKPFAFPSGSSSMSICERIIYGFVPVKLETNPIEDPMRRGDLENPAANRSGQVIVQKYDWGSQTLKTMLWKELELLAPLVKQIRGQKQMHLEALALLKCVCEQIKSLNDSNAYVSFAEDAVICATRLGIREVIEEIVDSFPDLMWTRDEGDRTIFQRAVIDRHENVFNLLYQMSDHGKKFTKIQDSNGNTMLHFAGILAPKGKLDLIPGAALQMQYELQWFKEVKKLVNPQYAEWRNDDGETPAMVFTKNHKKLRKEGQKWMKDTGNSCAIVAALIITVLFAAAITVPGGNDDHTGLPIFSKKPAFIVFVVSNAISLVSSTTFLVMFLSIVTSRYAESDFLYVLPRRLIIGLGTLFLSIMAMILAFIATIHLAFGHDEGWILLPMATLFSVPIVSFTLIQYPLLRDLIALTYGPGIFRKQSDRPFY